RPARNAAQQRLTRERYRLLWDITIDGRLAAVSRAAASGLERHRAAFDRAFGFWADEKRNQVFFSLRGDPQPRHNDLLAVASDPRDLKAAHEPTPGAPCPLCGFPTFAWADTPVMSAQTTAAIQAEFPDWLPEQGVCKRCGEIYRRMVPA